MNLGRSRNHQRNHRSTCTGLAGVSAPQPAAWRSWSSLRVSCRFKKSRMSSDDCSASRALRSATSASPTFCRSRACYARCRSTSTLSSMRRSVLHREFSRDSVTSANRVLREYAWPVWQRSRKSLRPEVAPGPRDTLDSSTATAGPSPECRSRAPNLPGRSVFP
jgi:hypothetical protein